jgi:hypothetical protein
MWVLIMNKVQVGSSSFDPCVVKVWETRPSKQQVQKFFRGCARGDDGRCLWCPPEEVAISKGLEVFSMGLVVGRVKRIRSQTVLNSLDKDHCQRGVENGS